MAGSNFFALIDDIATLLDDVAILSKVAVKKTAGVLGDDLALNAQQVSGVSTDRELPVVFAVAKGSFVNKAILVPSALAISYFAPWAISPLLMIGGLYLCFEGCEKLAHKFLHDKEDDEKHHADLLNAVSDHTVDIVAFEKEKIRGAIRTDFILSAEIVVIALGTMADATFAKQVVSIVGIAILMTVGVYGLVGGIVKLDDLGLFLAGKKGVGWHHNFGRWAGKKILLAAPLLMKSLSVVGTVAMFMVGGGIIVHGLSFLHHLIESISSAALAFGPIAGPLKAVLTVTLEAFVGVVAGFIVLLVVLGIGKIRHRGRSKVES